MNLSGLLPSLKSLPQYMQLKEVLNARASDAHSLHVPSAARAAIASALSEDMQRPILYLVSKADRILTLQEEFPVWAPEIQVISFPDPDPLFYQFGPWSPRTRASRISALSCIQQSACGSGRNCLIIATARSLMTRTISTDQFQIHSQMIQPAQAVPSEVLIRNLSASGYTRANLVTEPGQFSRRGGIIDVWPPAESEPVRMDFFGDVLENINHFDPTSQRTTASLDCISLVPAREGIPAFIRPEWEEILLQLAEDEALNREDYFEFFLPFMNPNPVSMIDFLDQDAIILFEDRTSFEATVEEIEEHALQLRSELALTTESIPTPYLSISELLEAMESQMKVDLGFGFIDGQMYEPDFSGVIVPGPRFGGQLQSITNYLVAKQTEHETCIVVSRQAPRLSEIWSEFDPDTFVRDTLPLQFRPGDTVFIHGPLTEGWSIESAESNRIHLLTDTELFGWSRPKPRRRPPPKAIAPEFHFDDLSHGDTVVHMDFGIGQFSGLVERTIDDVKREYLLIEYADGDELYVPIHQADRVTRYVGADGQAPKFSRLGTREWERSKRRAHEAVEEVARDLLELYAERQTVPGISFSPDTAWQRELEASFPHQETADQILALAEVKKDMERPIPMDRLICGDVGYGKTEVALRAAFKSVMDGKQAAILVPTTVLAQQHFNTFRRRLAAFPVEIEMLSRFRTPVESRVILERLGSGEIDIVIGTHRLLQPDVYFRDLGLLIIDEEQRFGVTHKETLKKMRTSVDVLTLTATPIPRTLYMALTGARDISTINTPPEERLPVVTHVGPYQPRLIRGAILRELDRGGQIFFVHNRVQTIETVRRQLEALVPEARFVVGHGQMVENELSERMEAFAAGEIDVLISTSIIESGLDIPNANTLIVDRADRFGLSQLYQLRGRVGRGPTQGYAYFFRLAQGRTTKEAMQRLDTIAEHTQLGSGFSIAMRDLEIRGAGDVLGTRQHGHISAVGFHLYTRLLSAAVRRLRTSLQPDDAMKEAAILPDELPPASVDLPLTAVIPEGYIPSRDLRLQLYRRMADMKTLAELNSLEDELVDRFGKLPEEVENLLYQLRVKLLATMAGISTITIENGQIFMEIIPERQSRIPGLPKEGIRLSKRGIFISRYYDYDWREEILRILTSVTGVDPSSRLS
jgi:transcription-repair coupling factor (superfamily II helicase)